MGDRNKVSLWAASFQWPLAKIYTILLLVMITIGFFEFTPRYETIGTNLVRNSGFEYGLRSWNVVGGKDIVRVTATGVTLKNYEPSKSVSIRQPLQLPLGVQFVLMEGEISTKNVEQGEESWHNAAVFLIGRTADETHLWSLDHMLIQLSGNKPSRQYSKIFQIVDNVKDILIGASLLNTTGILNVSDLRVFPVKEYTAFGVVMYVLLFVWVIALIIVGRALFSIINSGISRLFLVVIVFTILIGALTPGDVKQHYFSFLWDMHVYFGQILNVEQSITKEVDIGGLDFFGLDVSRIGHFSLFFALSALIFHSFQNNSSAFNLFSLFIFAAVTEVLQYYSPGRQPMIIDWLYDVAGITLAYVMWKLIKRSHRKEG